MYILQKKRQNKKMSDKCKSCKSTNKKYFCGNNCGAVYCSRACGNKDWVQGHKQDCIGHQPGFFPNPDPNNTSKYHLLTFKTPDEKITIVADHVNYMKAHGENQWKLSYSENGEFTGNDSGYEICQSFKATLNSNFFEIWDVPGNYWIIPYKSVISITENKLITVSPNLAIVPRQDQFAVIAQNMKKFKKYYRYEGEHSYEKLWRMVEAMWDAPGMPGANQVMADFMDEGND